MSSSVDYSNEILKAIVGFRAAKVLFVAAHYEIFTRVHAGLNTVARLCREMKTSPRATEILMDALAGLGYLAKSEGGVYRNTAVSGAVLVKGRPGYMGDNLKYQEILSDPWVSLRDVVKTGKNKRPLEYWLFEHETFFREYIFAMHNIAVNPARELAAKIPLKGAKALLDVGAGPGSFSLACLKREPGLRATLLDLPSTIKIAREVLSKERVSDRVDYQVGDYKKVSLGDAKYDVVIMSHITHNEGEPVNRMLFSKARRALKPGGSLVIHDFMTDKTRTATVFDALFSVHMLLSTEEGRAYSTEEYTRLLRKEKFNDIQKHAICEKYFNSSHILIASRAS